MGKLTGLFVFFLFLHSLTGLPAETRNPVVYGIVPDSPPTTYVDEHGHPAGFFVELFTSLMKELDIPYVIEVAPFSELYPRLISGEVDLFTSLLKTEARQELFYFPDISLAGGWGQLFIAPGTEFIDIMTLANKKIGMVKDDLVGKNFCLFMQNLSLTFEPVEVDSFNELFAMVRKGELFGGVTANTTLLGVEGIIPTATVFSPQSGYPVTALNNDFIPDFDRIMARLAELKSRENSYFYTLQERYLTPRRPFNRSLLTAGIVIIIILTLIVFLLVFNKRYLDRTIRNRTMDLERAALIFENSVEGIIITDQKQNILKVNKAFEKITGYVAAEVLSRRPVQLLPDSHKSDVYQNIIEGLANKGLWRGEIWSKRKSGEIYPQLTSIVRNNDSSGHVTGFSIIFSDLSDRRKLEDDYNFLTFFDSLTGLPNRTLFQDRLKMAAGKADRQKNQVAVISLGLDNFSLVNHTYGSDVGDQLLRNVGDRLENICRKTDTISRYGGDEFNIFLTDVDSVEDVSVIVSKIQTELQKPFSIEGKELFSSATQGISLYPGDNDAIDAVLKNSNLALRKAKKQGKGSFAFYRREDDEALKKRQTLETMLRSALERDEIKIHYQPKFSMEKGCITGTEALIRWQRSDGEMVYPDEFIPILEESGLIIPYGEWVLKKACQDMNRLNQTRTTPLNLAVNLSGVQFSDKLLVSKILSILDETGFPPENLEVEVTESMAMKNIDTTLSVLEKLRDSRISIAVDDFGTGYSSLSYIQKFPLSTLKIDKSFIKQIPDKRSDTALVRSIISLAQVMNINVIAEGVETESQFQYLKNNNCREIQGYYISKPLALEHLKKIL